MEYTAPPHQKLSYGDAVPSITGVRYRCNENHLVDKEDNNFCFNGEWKNDVPDCQPFCSTKVITGVSIQATSCHLNDAEVRCSEPARPGTTARINCRNRYEMPGARQQILSCDENGNWSPQPQVCTPICGEEAPIGTPYIVGGFETNITKVPWHVGIYKSNDAGGFVLQCGGTIVNARVVISAMHCFWDRLEDKPFSVGEFRIVAGKFKRDYNADENLKTQIFSVDKIHYVDGYSDITGLYASDIAILVLNTFIEFKTHISPICMDYDLTFDDRTVPAGWTGRVAGWGLEANNGQPSPLLKVIELPAVSRAECRANSSREFLPYITSDKFCAGYLTGISVCQVILHLN